MVSVLLVGAGGFCGAVFRYLMYFIPLRHEFPIITLVINVLGSFVIGLASELLTDDLHRKFVMTGLCGGFTTFSAFSHETFSLLDNRNYALAGVYAVGSVLTCVFGTYLGIAVGKAIKTGNA
ncbi:MAG: CrcB family protein [Bifidobacteriaceae bacterium]|jgi:CrcB protein|nr:CrcB family protein [Bifidobacteriaceae bacterium]